MTPADQTSISGPEYSLESAQEQIGDSLARNDLGSSIIGTTTRGLEEVTVRHEVTETKVGNLEVLFSGLSGIKQQAVVSAGTRQSPKRMSHFSGLRSR